MAIGQHRNRRCSAVLVLPRDSSRIEIGKNIALARRRALDLRDDRRTMRPQRRNEIAGRHSIFRTRHDRYVADDFAPLLQLLAFRGKYFVEYGTHFDFGFFAPLPLLLRRISSMTSIAASDPITSRALATPSASEPALPP